MIFNRNKNVGSRIYKFNCAKCSEPVSVNFSRVKKGFKAICRKCGAEYPFSESDERLVRKFKKSI